MNSILTLILAGSLIAGFMFVVGSIPVIIDRVFGNKQLSNGVKTFYLIIIITVSLTIIYFLGLGVVYFMNN